MKIKHITFTGIDEHTDVEVLKSIKKEFPLAEFGVLMSRSWQLNGNRYPNPDTISRFTNQGLDLSAHLCGGIARSAYSGNFDDVIKSYPIFTHTDFKRVQLNVAPYENIFETVGKVDESFNKEIIIQQKSSTMLYRKAYDKFWYNNPNISVSMLVDPSGGRGIDEGLDVVATNEKIGYAGGINGNNVEEKLEQLMRLKTVENFWIDMESGVRTDDWFDVNKVVDVLEKCKNILGE